MHEYWAELNAWHNNGITRKVWMMSEEEGTSDNQFLQIYLASFLNFKVIVLDFSQKGVGFRSELIFYYSETLDSCDCNRPANYTRQYSIHSGVQNFDNETKSPTGLDSTDVSAAELVLIKCFTPKCKEQKTCVYTQTQMTRVSNLTWTNEKTTKHQENKDESPIRIICHILPDHATALPV